MSEIVFDAPTMPMEGQMADQNAGLLDVSMTDDGPDGPVLADGCLPTAAAAAGDAPRRVRGKSANYLLKSLEQSSTSFLGDDLVQFAEFDQEGSPRMTRAQVRKRRSGVVSPPRSPLKKKRSSKARKSEDPVNAVQQPEQPVDVEQLVNNAGADENMDQDAAADKMEKGELPLEDATAGVDASEEIPSTSGSTDKEIPMEEVLPEAPAEEEPNVEVVDTPAVPDVQMNRG